MKCSFFDGPKGVPLFMTPTPAVLRGRAWWRRRGFLCNSCCDQGLSVPYSLASKTGVMLSSRDVRASVPKYMVSVPEIYISGHFALSAPTLRRKGQFSSRLVHHVCFACPLNCPRTATIDLRTAVPLFIVSQNRCRALCVVGRSMHPPKVPN